MRALVHLAVAIGLSGCARKHHGPPSDHFSDGRFHNTPESWQPSSRDFFRWRRTRNLGTWAFRANRPHAMVQPRVECPDLKVTFINHATLLIQTAGLNILTDPIYSERSSPVRGSGPKRMHPPGIVFDELPAIDVVWVSHNHYDHMDTATLRRLSRTHHPRILVGLGNAKFLRRKRVDNTHELGWWASVTIAPGVRIWGVPAKHWSMRGLTDRDRTLWLGYVLETPCGRTYFAGDTAEGPHFEAIANRFSPLRLALLPIGAYRPRWFMRASHIDPAQAVAAHRVLGARTSIAMHFGTFALADEGQDEPVRELRQALTQAEQTEFWVLDPGEGRRVQ